MILISGPCVIETKEITMQIAGYLAEIKNALGIDLFFKASFDKANRSSINSYRGPGIKEGLYILNAVKDKYDLKICTDIHEPWQAEAVAETADMIQIPAFLCRQTDLLLAAAKTDRIINVKKGQFMAPWDMQNVVDKIKSVGNTNITICERGTSFGYNRLVVDMTSIYELRKIGCSVIFDATHSVQKPGGKGESSDGSREYVPTLMRSAIAAGADGLFIETHPAPERALSDGANSLRLSDLKENIESVLKIKSVIDKYGNKGQGVSE